GADWKRVAGVPPMHYPTHTTGSLVSATGAHVVKVACHGFRDDHHPDEVFGEGRNDWDNPFSNETALMHMSNGGTCRVSEYRRIAFKLAATYISAFYGTNATYHGGFVDHH